MNFLNKSLGEKKSLFLRIFFRKKQKSEVHRLENFNSKYLKRSVLVELYLPPHFFSGEKKSFRALFFNDGQDMKAVKLERALRTWFQTNTGSDFIVVGIHAADRMQEYGTAHQADYKKRGAKAKSYTRFIVKELLPFLQDRYKVSQENRSHVIAGFSLGGLSAFDIAWNQSDHFAQVGVFSGSFWWRSKAFKEEDPDADRIVQDLLEKEKKKNGMRFWMQTGTNDETSDRNNNGIIDAIDDTLDVIKALKALGYEDKDINYVEVKDGEHNPDTWGKVLPKFLKWIR